MCACRRDVIDIAVAVSTLLKIIEYLGRTYRADEDKGQVSREFTSPKPSNLKHHRLPVLSANMPALTRGFQMPSTFPRLRLYVLPLRSYSTRDRTSDRIPTNDPSPRKPVQNVSDSNAIPISPQGLRDSDRPLQEVPEDSERQRVMQAPNREGVWSRSQQPRERAMSGPRFEQTIMEYQVCSHMLRDSI